MRKEKAERSHVVVLCFKPHQRDAVLQTLCDARFAPHIGVLDHHPVEGFQVELGADLPADAAGAEAIGALVAAFYATVVAHADQVTT